MTGLFVFLAAGMADAMIRTLSLADMVRKADVIMIAEVVLKTEIPAESGGWPRLHHMLQPKEVLKGQIPLDQQIVFDTFGSLDENVYLEDTPQVPARGRQAVFFLSHGTNGTWYAVNAIQGVWPIDSKTSAFLGMGTGTTREQVVVEVRKQDSEDEKQK